MNLPFFYKENVSAGDKVVVFEEETSKHIVQVLRMGVGRQLQITDGKGNLFGAEITKDHKRKCEVNILSTEFTPRAGTSISIAISLLKNANRFEWFLEKVTELGIHEIIPLICERTEKQHFRYDRMKNICISAMLQSQQVWLPSLHQPHHFMSLFELKSYEQKFIAHCIINDKRNLNDAADRSASSSIILIGPEGDFTMDEINMAIKNNYRAVALGANRLRTETAGVVSVAILAMNR